MFAIDKIICPIDFSDPSYDRYGHARPVRLAAVCVWLSNGAGGSDVDLSGFCCAGAFGVIERPNLNST